ncbi:methyltransferase domain-containing protein, partial [Piscirickettsia salmonis]
MNSEQELFLETHNKTGYIATRLDPFTKEFINYAGNCDKAVMEIGAGFGFASEGALKAGAYVICNDLEASHLDVLKNKYKGNRDLNILPGNILTDIELEANSLEAILVSRVIHFFSPSEVNQFIAKIEKWLCKGGRIYAVVETPYLKNWQKFIPTFHSRVTEGCEWPGFIADPAEYETAGRAVSLPKFVHWFDEKTIRKPFEAHGFKVLRCENFSRTGML